VDSSEDVGPAPHGAPDPIKIKAAADAIFTAIATLTPEERHRAIAAALAVFGEPPSVPTQGRKGPQQQQHDSSGPSAEGLSPKPTAWISKNGVTHEDLEQVFHLAGEIEIIASPRGKSKKEQTQEAYLLEGVRSFLRTGEATFTDDQARAFCRKSGCYDRGPSFRVLEGSRERPHGKRQNGLDADHSGLKGRGRSHQGDRSSLECLIRTRCFPGCRRDCAPR
jgi:hypothetical protein